MEAEFTTPAAVAPAMPAGPNPEHYTEPEPVTTVQALEAEVEQRLVRDAEPPRDGSYQSVTPDRSEPVVYPPGVLALPLGDGDAQRVVHVFPADEWTSSTQDMLRTGDFNGWAERALAHDVDVDAWFDMNNGEGPKIREINDMFTELERVSGQSAGKSRNSRRSSRSGLRR